MNKINRKITNMNNKHKRINKTGARTEFDDFFISLREKMGDIGQIVMEPNLRELRSQHKFITTSEGKEKTERKKINK